MNKDLLNELIGRALFTVAPEIQSAFEHTSQSYDANDLHQTLINLTGSKPKRVSLSFNFSFLVFAWPLADEAFKQECMNSVVMSSQPKKDLFNYLG